MVTRIQESVELIGEATAAVNCIYREQIFVKQVAGEILSESK